MTPYDLFWVATICGGVLTLFLILDGCRVRIERWRSRRGL